VAFRARPAATVENQRLAKHVGPKADHCRTGVQFPPPPPTKQKGVSKETPFCFAWRSENWIPVREADGGLARSLSRSASGTPRRASGRGSAAPWPGAPAKTGAEGIPPAFAPA